MPVKHELNILEPSPCKIIFLSQARVNQELPSKHDCSVPAPNLAVVVSQLHLFPVNAVRVEEPEILGWGVQLAQASVQGEQGGSG